MTDAGSANRPPIETVPVGLRVAGKDVLVVGAGPVAARKASVYVDQGARVSVVAPTHSDDMERVAVAERLRRRFQPADLDRKWLAITATGRPEVDGEVFAEAERRRIWCNGADAPDACSFILPAVARRGPITVAIGSGGTSPAAASWLRRRIERLLDDRTMTVIEVATRVRHRVRAAGYPTEVPGWADVLGCGQEACQRGHCDPGACAVLSLVDDDTVELERRLFDAVLPVRPDDSPDTETDKAVSP
jgi:siroheme synthase-like protein